MPYDLNYKEFQKQQQQKKGSQSRKMVAKAWKAGQIGRDF